MSQNLDTTVAVIDQPPLSGPGGRVFITATPSHTLDVVVTSAQS